MQLILKGDGLARMEIKSVICYSLPISCANVLTIEHISIDKSAFEFVSRVKTLSHDSPPFTFT